MGTDPLAFESRVLSAPGAVRGCGGGAAACVRRPADTAGQVALSGTVSTSTSDLPLHPSFFLKMTCRSEGQMWSVFSALLVGILGLPLFWLTTAA